jgi:hypothetical protein
MRSSLLVLELLEDSELDSSPLLLAESQDSEELSEDSTI